MRVCSTNLPKTRGKKRNFLLQAIPPFLSVIFPFGELYAIFIKFEIVFCKIFQFGRVLILSFEKRFPIISCLYDFVDPDKQENWSQKSWEDLLCKMLSKSLDVVDHEEWIAELGEAFGNQITLYTKYPEEKVRFFFIRILLPFCHLHKQVHTT